jgi:hypothetical protein
MKTIEDIQDTYAKALTPFTPEGYCAVVALLDSNGRKKRKDAAAHHWDPVSGSVSITFVKPEARRRPTSNAKVILAGIPRTLAEAVRALDAAEHKVSFVSLKWFRDQFLPGFGVAWAATAYAGQETIKDAIDRNLFLTSKVQNPKAPAFPVTAIRLNRDLPEVQHILGSTPVAHNRIFRPVDIAGESLSGTIIRERG